MPNWTKEQLLAITEEGKNIIVSAGAGSGKTAVLTERVIRKLKEGTHINELLILTFTNAAAAEMRERIRKAINKDSSLKEEASLIDSAYICTFDAFSLAMVKKYHTRLNITNNIKVCDEVLLNIAKNNILTEIMDEYYQKPSKEFASLINNFCFKKDDNLKDYILNIYNKLELKYDKTDYLKNYIKNYYSNDNLKKYLEEYLSIIKESINNIKEFVHELSPYLDGDYMYKLKQGLSSLFNSKTYKEIRLTIENKVPQLPKNSDEEAKRIKTCISEEIKYIKELTSYINTDEIIAEILSTKENSHVIIEILQKLNERIIQYKNDNELYNFTDIAHLAIKVVEDNIDVREELTNSFKEILVDEYQDTSDTQELFISLISHNNIYMVGDIKQSIYRFRNANPNIFRDKYNNYSKGIGGYKIDLNKNFRSRKEVVDNINTIFNLVMDEKIGGANYQDSHQMIFGNENYLKNIGNKNYNLEILIYHELQDKTFSKDEADAFIIGNDIKEKINNNYQVLDKETNILRPIKYSDIVILLDNSKNFDLFKKVFEYLGIPLAIQKDSSLTNDKDLLIIKNLFQFLINLKNNNYNEEFKYNFVSLSRSFLFKISDEEIYHYLATNSYTDSNLYKLGLELINNIDLMAPAEYLLYILKTINYEERLLTISSIKNYQVRIEYLYNLIRDFEQSGNTIYDFVNYLEEIYNNEYDIRFASSDDVNNSCQIMTIHKSKGLEFSLCYYANFYHRFNISELNERILYDNYYGIVLPKVDGYYKDTIIKILLKNKTKEEEISERMRLLYVALTRAKEHMIIVIPELEEVVNYHGLVPFYERKRYNSFLSIIKSVYSHLLDYVEGVSLVYTKDYLTNIKNLNKEELILDKDDLVVKELDIQSTIINESHFSKDSLHIITKEEKEKLEFGTKVHEILELLDFKNPDYTNIDNRIVEKIKKFLNTDLIKENINNNMYKEYEFIYTEEEKLEHGIIDLLIECPNKYIIVDYKLKNIDDLNYQKQLNGYRRVIEEKTNKKVDCYLYSIIDSTISEVTNN